jgi:anti-sigma factor RsiW
VSLRLDDELSQLERRMLDAHLVRCAECDAYAADLIAFTYELRSAPREALERPAVIRHRPRHRHRIALARLQGAVAAAAVVIVTIGLAAQLTSSGRGDATLSNFNGTVTRFPTQAELDRELAILERLPARRTSSIGSAVL